MVAAHFPLHSSSLLDLARAGDFSALAYWINRALIPDGFYARVRGGGVSGCVDVCVEFPAPRTATQSELQTSIIRRICHQLWQLNSKAIYGVKVSGSLPGRAEVLWQQTVRIVTPANQQLPWNGVPDWSAVLRPVARGAASLRDWVRSRYKTLRALFLAGSAVAAFTLGSWFSLHTSLEWLDRQPTATPAAIVETVPMPDRPFPGVPFPQTPPAPRSSGLARIRSALDRIARPSITPIEPPLARADRRDVVMLFGGNVSFAGPLAGENARAFGELGALAAADVTSLTLGSPLSAVARAEAEFAGTIAAEESQAARVSESARGAIEALQMAGVDAVNLANGRILADGESGLNATLDQLDAAGIATLGAGRDTDEAARARILEVKGVKIAVLGYATADYTVARDRRSGVNEALHERIHQDITELRDRVDWIVVNYHWGDTASRYPAHWQTELARHTVDVGADAIVGHSAGTLQGAETYRDRPIVYSLGQLVNNEKYGFGGEAALLRLQLDGETIAADFIPVELWNGRPVAADPDSARWIVQHIEDLSQGFDRPLARLADDAEISPSTAPQVSVERAEEDADDDVYLSERSASERLLPEPSLLEQLPDREPEAAPASPIVAPAFGLSPEAVGSAIAPSASAVESALEVPVPEAASEPVSQKLSRPLSPLTGRWSVEQSLDRLDPAIAKAVPAEPDFQHPDLQRERRDLASELQALDLNLRQPSAIRPDELAPLELPPLPDRVPADLAPQTDEPAAEFDSPFDTTPLVSYDALPLAPLPEPQPVRDRLEDVGRATGVWSQAVSRESLSFSIDGVELEGSAERAADPMDDRSGARSTADSVQLPQW